MELRVFPTHMQALEAFNAERGVGHYFTRLEVVKLDGSRVKFVGMNTRDPLWQLRGMQFDKVTVSDAVPEDYVNLLGTLLGAEIGRKDQSQ